MRIILSGGGTGGHIYPAVAVAEALIRKLDGDVELLFVGAEGKMEMEKIPALGYRIVGLPVAGLQRRLCAENFSLPGKVLRSLRKARRTIRDFRADAVAGFGGYASAPVLWQAQRMGIPTLIQEQNSYAGVTNKILARRADCICVAYDGMDRFFPADKIVMTGNPLRGSFGTTGQTEALRGEALNYFGLDPSLPTVLFVGGSLGTRTLNEVVMRSIDEISSDGHMQVIWQSGRFYEEKVAAFMSERSGRGIWRGTFIDRMDLAYAAAEVVVSRSGACTVSELCLVGKPVIFVPSPNVSEDHQTKNARALESRGAAMLIPDNVAVEQVMPAVKTLLGDESRRRELAHNISQMAIADSADRVADHLIAICKK